MDLKTKLDIGNEIFFIHESKVIQSVVRQILILVEENGNIEIKYLCNVEPDQRVNIKVGENISFKTKKELINSL